MKFFAIIFLFFGMHHIPSLAAPEDDLMLLSSPFFEPPSKHKHKNDDIPPLHSRTSLLQQILFPPFRFFFPPRQPRPFEFWRLRIVVDNNLTEKAPITSPYVTSAVVENQTDSAQIYKKDQSGDTITLGHHNEHNSPFRLANIFPFLFHSKIENLKSHRAATVNMPKNGNGAQGENLADKNLNTKHFHLLKAFGLHNRLNKLDNSTEVDCYHTRFARIWNIDWGSVMMHIFFILFLALMITLAVVFCHSITVRINVGRMKMNPQVKGSANKSSRDEKTNSNQC